MRELRESYQNSLLEHEQSLAQRIVDQGLAEQALSAMHQEKEALAYEECQARIEACSAEIESAKAESQAILANAQVHGDDKIDRQIGR